MVGVEVRGLNACPCAQGLVRERASERLADAGYDDAQIAEIFSTCCPPRRTTSGPRRR